MATARAWSWIRPCLGSDFPAAAGEVDNERDTELGGSGGEDGLDGGPNEEQPNPLHDPLLLHEKQAPPALEEGPDTETQGSAFTRLCSMFTVRGKRVRGGVQCKAKARA